MIKNVFLKQLLSYPENPNPGSHILFDIEIMNFGKFPQVSENFRKFPIFQKDLQNSQWKFTAFKIPGNFATLGWSTSFQCIMQEKELKKLWLFQTDLHWEDDSVPNAN